MQDDRRSADRQGFQECPNGTVSCKSGAGRAEKGSGSGVKIYLRTLDIKVTCDGPAGIVRDHLVVEGIKKRRRLVFKFLERQLHVAIIVLVVCVIPPVMPGKKRKKAYTRICGAMLQIVAIQNGRLCQLIQRRGFPDH